MFSGTEPRIILNPGNFTLPDVRTYRIRGFLIAEGERKEEGRMYKPILVTT